MAGGGIGAQCPVCPQWFATVDDAWIGHLRAEHPARAAQLRAAARSDRGREGAEVRAELRREATARARELAELRPTALV